MEASTANGLQLDFVKYTCKPFFVLTFHYLAKVQILPVKSINQLPVSEWIN